MMLSNKFRELLEDPDNKDRSLLLSVENCIELSFGDPDDNIINFKMLQTVLHILARQLCMLEQDVEIKFGEVEDKPKEEHRSGSSTEEEIERPKGKKVGIEKKGKGKPGKSKKGKKDDRGILNVKEVKGPGEGESTLIVEKSAMDTDSKTRIGAIEVVTRSEFEALESLVHRLLSKMGPVPMPILPDNEKLKEAMAAGTTTLTDTMEALQVNARIQAAEQGLKRMAGLLTQLAVVGALPDEFNESLIEMQKDLRDWGIEIDGFDDLMTLMRARQTSVMQTLSTMANTRSQAVSFAASGSALSVLVLATPAEVEAALNHLKDDMMKNLNNVTSKSLANAENANNLSRTVADKMHTDWKLATRIEALYSTTSTLTDQLHVFDRELTKQINTFQEAMTKIAAELKEGLIKLDAVGFNAETAAVMEIRKAYDVLVINLDATSHSHSGLVILEGQLSDELRGLTENVKNLCEQKAGREEVEAGLKTKTDTRSLHGLLRNEVFTRCRDKLDERLDTYLEEFKKRDATWLDRLQQIWNASKNKAELMQLFALRDFATENLKEIHNILLKLEAVLGSPTEAKLTRILGRNAKCGSCMMAALMDPYDKNYGAPPPLDAMPAEHKAHAKKSDVTDLLIPPPPDLREHVCKRWVGGSHTMLTVTECVTRETEPLIELDKPTKRFAGYGTDGRLYMMEERVQPCIEGRRPPTPVSGAGDWSEYKHKCMARK